MLLIVDAFGHGAIINHICNYLNIHFKQTKTQQKKTKFQSTLFRYITCIFYLWQRAAQRQELLELTLIFADNDARFRVLGNVTTGLARVRRVDAGRLAASENSAAIRHEPLGTVESDHVDRLVRLEADVQQRLGKLTRALIVLLPGPRVPLVALLLTHGDLVAILGDGLLEARHDGLGSERRNALGGDADLDERVGLRAPERTRRVRISDVELGRRAALQLCQRNGGRGGGGGGGGRACCGRSGGSGSRVACLGLDSGFLLLAAVLLLVTFYLLLVAFLLLAVSVVVVAVVVVAVLVVLVVLFLFAAVLTGNLVFVVCETSQRSEPPQRRTHACAHTHARTHTYNDVSTYRNRRRCSRLFSLRVRSLRRNDQNKPMKKTTTSEE